MLRGRWRQVGASDPASPVLPGLALSRDLLLTEYAAAYPASPAASRQICNFSSGGQSPQPRPVLPTRRASTSVPAGCPRPYPSK